jgi:hypothetical protein
MIHRLDTGRMQATVLNFSARAVTVRLASEHLSAGAAVTDMLTDDPITEVDEGNACGVPLRPYEGRALLIG